MLPVPKKEMMSRCIGWRGARSAVYVEQRYVHRLGHVVWIALSVSLVRDVNGQPVHFIAQFQDVTERVEAVAALRTSEARLRAVMSNAPIGLLRP